MFQGMREAWQDFADGWKGAKKPAEAPVQWYDITVEIRIHMKGEKPISTVHKYQHIDVSYRSIMNAVAKFFTYSKYEFWYTGNTLYFKKPYKVVLTKVTTEKIK